MTDIYINFFKKSLKQPSGNLKIFKSVSGKAFPAKTETKQRHYASAASSATIFFWSATTPLIKLNKLLIVL